MPISIYYIIDILYSSFNIFYAVISIDIIQNELNIKINIDLEISLR